MPLRITTRHETHQTTLQVDGYLCSPETQELIREYASADRPSVLELSQLISADGGGVRTLLELEKLGAKLHGASGYVRLLLELAASGD